MAQPNYRRLARRDARKYGLDPNVYGRQIQQESSYNPNARSPAGAIGIAQITPATAKAWGVNPRDPIASLDVAAREMAKYVKQYGSIKNALVAYNAGPGRVGGHLPAETQNYLRTILGGSGSYHGGWVA
jgi:soluble lytic murein transglycosylase-like protein